MTAHHVFNDSQPRDPQDKFYILQAPGNGPALRFWPVTGFVLEDQQRDLAIITAPIPGGSGFAVPPIAIAATIPPDGADVLTYGCPSPIVAQASVSPAGDLTSIISPLFTHANKGILAAQYAAGLGTEKILEFNVGWHIGESGGPVLRTDPTVAAISVMQHYRNIQGPNGIMAGPRRGWALHHIITQLQAAGATIV